MGRRHHLNPDLGDFLYLAIVFDVFNRRIVGWAMAPLLRTELLHQALDMVPEKRRAVGMDHHSDQGRNTRRRPSMSVAERPGVPLHRPVGVSDAMAESFFANLECEPLTRYTFRNRAAARLAVFKFIEGRCNLDRRHSALDYLSPVANKSRYEESLAKLGSATLRTTPEPSPRLFESRE